MNTPSHFLINYSLGRWLKLPQRYKIRMDAVVWGSLAPDMMLYLLSVGAIVYYRFMSGWSMERATDYVFDTLFFQNPWWIALHNFFQAPFVLLTIIAISALMLYAHRERRETTGYRVALWILVFSLSASLHTIIDILTHHDDGPLLLFPFSSTVRFRSPVSYWDPRHYGRIFAIGEGLLDLGLVGYLIYLRVIRRRLRVQTQAGGGG